MKKKAQPGELFRVSHWCLGFKKEKLKQLKRDEGEESSVDHKTYILYANMNIDGPPERPE